MVQIEIVSTVSLGKLTVSEFLYFTQIERCIIQMYLIKAIFVVIFIYVSISKNFRLFQTFSIKYRGYLFSQSPVVTCLLLLVVSRLL